MMKNFFTVLFLMTVQCLFAQEEETYANGVFYFQDQKTQRVFTDWARVRQAPSVNAAVLDSLHTNQKILILGQDKAVLKLGERRANWYKVSYQKEDKNLEGYIWGGNLCVGYRNKNGYDFLFGLTKTIYKKDKEYPDQTIAQNLASIKAIQDNILIDEVSFDIGQGESLATGIFGIESNHKLQNVELTLNAGVSGEACGIPRFDQYILFANKKMIVLPQLVNVGDADIFYHSEEFVFPNDKGGVANAIIFKMEEMEKDEKGKEKIKRKSKTYLWDGSNYQLKQ